MNPICTKNNCAKNMDYEIPRKPFLLPSSGTGTSLAIIYVVLNMIHSIQIIKIIQEFRGKPSF
jgi:hypothetical protein